MSTQKNIILFCTDQQRKDTIGAYGNNICNTPSIDNIAKKGLTFQQAYTPTAICTPARASVITGLLPYKHSLLANFERNVGYPTELDDKIIPFSTYLKNVGYRVGNVGKWHIGIDLGPEDYGFEGPHYPGWSPAINHPDYVKYLEENELPQWTVRDQIRGTFPNGEPGNIIAGIYEGPVEATYPYFLAERAIERIQEYKGSDKPFYLACNFFGPHLPYYLPKEYADMYNPEDVKLPLEKMKENFQHKPKVQEEYSKHWSFDSFNIGDWRKLTAMYWGYVTLIDEQIGRVMDVLKKEGIIDETVVFFTTDHGAFVGSHKLQDKGPAMYDDIYQIPMIVSFPGSEMLGQHDEHFVSLIDLPATFLDIAGIEIPEEFDGRSLLPLLKGEEPGKWREEIICEFHGHHFPYPQRMIRNKRYKLVVNPPDVNELYDLKKDPNELYNLIDSQEYKDIKQDLYSRLYRKLKKRGDNFYHWMSSMFEIGEKVEDATLSHYSKGD